MFLAVFWMDKVSNFVSHKPINAVQGGNFQEFWAQTYLTVVSELLVVVGMSIMRF